VALLIWTVVEVAVELADLGFDRSDDFFLGGGEGGAGDRKGENQKGGENEAR